MNAVIVGVYVVSYFLTENQMHIYTTCTGFSEDKMLNDPRYNIIICCKRNANITLFNNKVCKSQCFRLEHAVQWCYGLSRSMIYYYVFPSSMIKYNDI